MLTPADKKWLRTMVRAEIAAALEEQVHPTQGGYDGATSYVDDGDNGDDVEVKAAKHPVIGFNGGTDQS